MRRERPILTIAIPTYNRSRYLRELFSTLIPQLKGQSDVELLISDNCSTDDTPDLVGNLLASGCDVRYLRNDVNIGSDANFMQCFQRAQGRYVWVMGDDDVVLPGAIDKILYLLRDRDYRLIYLCPYSFRENYEAEQQHDKFRRFAQSIPNGVPFIRKVGTSIAFISAMIANKDDYRNLAGPNLSDFVGSNLMHLGWLLPLLGSGGISLIVWDKLLAARDGNTGGWSICSVFAYSLRNVLGKTLQGKDEIAAQLLNNTLQVWFPLMIMQIRRSTAGSLNTEDFHEKLVPLFRGNWRYWFYVFPVARWPKLVAAMWFRITQGLNRAARLVSLLLNYPQWRGDLIWNSR